jgi:hypothetical protein
MNEGVIMKKVVNRISVSFQKEGIHKYPAALTDESLQDVSFLGHPHRHMFYFEVAIDVFHNDRDIEFIQFKRWLEALYEKGVLNLDHKSCEMLSDELAEHIGARYSKRTVTISIKEDNENGSYAVYVPELRSKD